MNNTTIEMETPPDRIKVLIVEDHEVVRKGILGLLEGFPDMEVVGEAADGKTAVRMAMELTPDVTVMDVMLPVLGGIEAARAIRSSVPETEILALSLHSDQEYVIGMLNAGALGYLLKDFEFPELINAVRIVNQSRFFLGQSLVKILSKDMKNIAREAGNEDERILTRSEEDLLDRMIAGKRTDDITNGQLENQAAIDGLFRDILKKWLALSR